MAQKEKEPVAKTSAKDKIQLAELLGTLSFALDLTEGQPQGHCVRVCWIGMHVGREIGLKSSQMWELYYTLLLKDLGCSSNAARICQLYLTDDRAFKRDHKIMHTGTLHAFKFVLQHTGLQQQLARRFRAAIDVTVKSGEYATELIETRCHAGADIARKLRFPEPVARGIQYLDEHWDGGGLPLQASGDEIPVYAQIALLSQVVDVFHTSEGKAAAISEIATRSGTWFDPVLAAAFTKIAVNDNFWKTLKSDSLDQTVFALEPAKVHTTVDDDYLDDIVAGFATVIDAKSPFTAGHSERVRLYTDLIAKEMGISAAQRRWLRRAALMHDIGKLAISNAILDKRGKLDPDEWTEICKHPGYSETILGRISIFAEIAKVAGAHHERLDGKGYPNGLKGEEIDMATRIITVADVFDAITSDRPYWHGKPRELALEIMQEDLGTAFDPECYQALCRALEKLDSQVAA